MLSFLALRPLFNLYLSYASKHEKPHWHKGKPVRFSKSLVSGFQNCQCLNSWKVCTLWTTTLSFLGLCRKKQYLSHLLFSHGNYHLIILQWNGYGELEVSPKVSGSWGRVVAGRWRSFSHMFSHLMAILTFSSWLLKHCPSRLHPSLSC